MQKPYRAFSFGVISFFLSLPQEALHALVEEGKKERTPSVFLVRHRYVDKRIEFFDYPKGLGAVEIFIKEVHEGGMVFHIHHIPRSFGVPRH